MPLDYEDTVIFGRACADCAETDCSGDCEASAAHSEWCGCSDCCSDDCDDCGGCDSCGY